MRRWKYIHPTSLFYNKLKIKDPKNNKTQEYSKWPTLLSACSAWLRQITYSVLCSSFDLDLLLWLFVYLFNLQMWCYARFSKPATLLKESLLHGCLSHFLNCTNDTKLRKVSKIPFERNLYNAEEPTIRNGINKRFMARIFSKPGRITNIQQ